MNPHLILITDPGWEMDRTICVIEQAAAALPAGAFMVQFRNKVAHKNEFRESAKRLHDVARRAGALFTVNAIGKNKPHGFDMAEELGADGLHVPCTQLDVGTAALLVKWCSVPSHTTKDLTNVFMQRPSAVLVSPIFPSHDKGPPRGLRALYEATDRCGRSSVFALGGIRPDYVPMCAEAGAKGVAVIRALLDADDVAGTARRLAAPFIAV